MTAFCEPPIMMSTSRSTSKCVVPSPVMASTTSRASLFCVRSSSAIAGTQWRAPVEVSVDCIKTARVSIRSALRTSSIEKVWPYGAETTSTSQEKARPSAVQRSPNLPAESTRMRSPGRGYVGNSSFHGAGAGRGEQQHVVSGADKELQVGKHPLKELAELWRTVVHVGRGHGKLRSGQQRGRSGGKQAGLANHAGLSAGLKWWARASAGRKQQAARMAVIVAWLPATVRRPTMECFQGSAQWVRTAWSGRSLPMW